MPVNSKNFLSQRNHVTRSGPGETAVAEWVGKKASDFANMSTTSIRRAANAGNPAAQRLIDAAKKAGRRLNEFKRTYGKGQPGTSANPRLKQAVEDVTPVVRRLGGRAVEGARGVGRGIRNLLDRPESPIPTGRPVGRSYDPNRVIGVAKGGVIKPPKKSSRKKSIDGLARKGKTRAKHR